MCENGGGGRRRRTVGNRGRVCEESEVRNRDRRGRRTKIVQLRRNRCKKEECEKGFNSHKGVREKLKS